MSQGPEASQHDEPEISQEAESAETQEAQEAPEITPEDIIEETRDEVTETLENPDETEAHIQACIESVDAFADNLDENPKIARLIGEEIYNQIGGSDMPFEQALETVKPIMEAYLKKAIQSQAENLETDPEMKKLVEWARDATDREIKEKVHELKKELEKNKEREEELKLEKEALNDEERMANTLLKGIKDAEARVAKATEISNKRTNIRTELDNLAKGNKRLNHQINLITQGAQDGLKKNRRGSAETVYFHLIYFFAKDRKEREIREGKTTRNRVDDMKLMQDSMVYARHKIEGASKPDWKELGKRILTLKFGPSRKEGLDYLANEKGPLSDLPKEALKGIAKLKKIDSDNLPEIEKWMSAFAKRFPEKERAEQLSASMVRLLGHLQNMIDEKHWTKAGISVFSLSDITVLKHNLQHAYRMHLTEEAKKKIRTNQITPAEGMKKLMDEIDTFHFKVQEERDSVSTILSDDAKEFLKEYRSKSWTSRAKGATWEWIKKHPKSTAATGVVLGSVIGFGFWPVVTVGGIGGGSYGAYKIRQWWKNKGSKESH